MTKRNNVLFIMCDQLRHDDLSGIGHKTLQPPNVDALAACGVRFSNACAQAPIYSPSRMSSYTGRYVSSHGATGNPVPLGFGERNIRDDLMPLGMRPVLVGKTHMVADQEGMKRLGVDPACEIGVQHAQAGFEPYERDDGIHPELVVKPGVAYNECPIERGHDDHGNPWHWTADSAEGKDGLHSGFFNDIANKPARATDEESETPYMTRRAMQFLAEDDGETSPPKRWIWVDHRITKRCAEECTAPWLAGRCSTANAKPCPRNARTTWSGLKTG